MAPVKVLITGGAGAVGSAIVQRMLERGADEFTPVVFDLAPASNALNGAAWPEVNCPITQSDGS